MPGIVDDERRRTRPQPPCALRVPGGAGSSAALPLLNDTRHRHRRGALHLAPRRPERGPREYSDRLLADVHPPAGLGGDPLVRREDALEVQRIGGGYGDANLLTAPSQAAHQLDGFG